MSEQVGVVTMHVWRIAPRNLPGALGAVARDRRRVRALTGVRFAKLLGTSAGFGLRDADPTRWALMVAWTSADAATAGDDSPVVRTWRSRARESWRVALHPLTARGRWSRREPFTGRDTARWSGPVAAITRARLAPLRAVTFWRAAAPVAADVWQRPGLRAGFGIGEAPLGVQGTFSIWKDATSLESFAYAGEAHRRVISETQRRGWYAEEYFARFGVLDSSGSLDGRDPLAGLAVGQSERVSR